MQVSGTSESEGTQSPPQAPNESAGSEDTAAGRRERTSLRTTQDVAVATPPDPGLTILRAPQVEQQSGTAGLGEPRAERARQVTRSIVLHVSQDARPRLVGDIGVLIQGLQGIVSTASNASQVPIARVDVGLRYLRKDRRRNPHVWMQVTTPPSVNPNQALALWDAIGLGIDRWTPRLASRARRLLQEQVSVSVDWVEP